MKNEGILDLFCHSLVKFLIIYGCDKIETERESFSSVSVSVCDDFESFQMGDNIFAGDTLTGYTPILRFFCLS